MLQNVREGLHKVISSSRSRSLRLDIKVEEGKHSCLQSSTKWFPLSHATVGLDATLFKVWGHCPWCTNSKLKYSGAVGLPRDRQTDPDTYTHTHTHTHTPQGLGKVRSAAHRGQINSKKQRTNDNQKPNEEHS